MTDLKNKKLSKTNKIKLFFLLFEKSIRIAKNDFYSFCSLLHPDFYNNDRPHLKELCTVLQQFVENKLLNKNKTPYQNIIIEIPPRHGKTRTLVLFSCWLLGKDNKFKIIGTSYNDDLAQKFSKYTRNIIQEEKIKPISVIYSDIFPNSKVKKDDGSVRGWALEGSYFSYKGAGTGGTLTGEGGNLIIVDDPVKSAEEAFNDHMLEKKWEWFTGTLLSRQEKNAKKIICHTPWALNDIGGRLQKNFSTDYYLYKRKAFDGKKMLCDKILSYSDYQKNKEIMNEIIFKANYDLERIEEKGLLYGRRFKTYEELPHDENNKPVYESKIMFCDTADRGDDYLCAIFGILYKSYFYVIDIVYTQEDVEITEPLLAEKLITYKINTARIEGNNAGHVIAKHIEKILEIEYKWFGTIFDIFTQSANKETRILSYANNVRDRILFPINWRNQFNSFYEAVTNFKRRGKNLHDDAPDTLTQIAEYINNDMDVENYNPFGKGIYG